MPEETTAAPSAPAQSAATQDGTSAPPPAATAAADTPANPTDAIDGIESYEELANLLDTANDPNRKAPEPQQSEPPAAPATQGGKTPPADSATPPAEPTQEETVTDDITEGKPLPKNFRFRTEDPKQAAFLRLMRQNPTANPIDLAHLAGYEGGIPRTPAGQQATTPPAQATPPVDPFKAQRDEIAAVREQIKKATENYESAKAMELNDRLSDLKIDLKEAEKAHTEQQSANAAWESDFTDSSEEAGALCPEAIIQGTPQFDELQREIAFIRVRHPARLSDPAYPVAVIHELAARRPDLFKLKGATNGTAAPAAQPAPARSAAAPARPVGAVVPGHTGTQQTAKTPAELAAAVDSLSMEEMEALSNAVGTKGKKG